MTITIMCVEEMCDHQNGVNGRRNWGCEIDIVPLTFGTGGYREYKENDLPGD